MRGRPCIAAICRRTFPFVLGINPLLPRRVCTDYPGAIHHVMSRGGRRETVYHDDGDRQEWVKTLAEACQQTDWQETVLSVKRIAARVHWGSHRTAYRNLHAWMKQEGKRRAKRSENSNKIWPGPLSQFTAGVSHSLVGMKARWFGPTPSPQPLPCARSAQGARSERMGGGMI
jgi:hypothetical protein